MFHCYAVKIPPKSQTQNRKPLAKNPSYDENLDREYGIHKYSSTAFLVDSKPTVYYTFLLKVISALITDSGRENLPCSKQKRASW
jgi:hypothetical protein